jgi:hypothetical protein
VFRLGVIQELFQQLRLDEVPDPVRDQEGNVIITATRVQRQLLRTAKSVLGLAARVDDLPELGELIRISHEGRAIGWRNFFYNANNMQRLFTSAQNGLAFPVAFAVSVRAIYPPRTVGDPYMISCRSSRVTDGKKQYYLSPTIWIRNAAIAEMIREQGTYLVLAQPDSLKLNKSYYNLHITLSSRHQICRY